MTSYGFNQNFTVGNFGSGGGGGFGGGFSYSVIEQLPSYVTGVKNDLSYEGYYNDDPYWFNYWNPTETTYPTGAIEDPINNTDPPDNYSRRWTGYFKAPTSGTFTFYLESDDASHMWIGDSAYLGWSLDNVFIDNGGLHGANEVSNTIELVSGTYYPIQVFFGEKTGGSVLKFSYSTDTIPKTTDLTGLLYHSDNLDPFLRGIENKTSVTLISSGSVIVNGQTFTWPTFDFTGPDPVGWNTLLVQGPGLNKIYAVAGSGVLGGPPQAVLNAIGRGDLPAGIPIACNSISVTGSAYTGVYGVRVNCRLGSIGPPIYSFLDYLSGNVHLPGNSPPLTWSDTYGSEPPDPGIVFTRIEAVDSLSNGNKCAQFLVFVTPPSVVQDHLELWFDSRFTASYPGTGTSWTDMKNGLIGTVQSGVTFDPVLKTMVFDGTGNAFVSTPNYVADLSTGYTLECYVRWDGLVTYDGVIAYNDPPRYANIEYNGFLGGVRFEGAAVQINDGHVPVLGTFYHYVATWDGSNNRLYRDGVLVAGPTGAVQPQSAAHTAAWFMGQWDSNLNGAITMTRLYSKALSDVEVAQNYAATVAGP